ncbi:MAG: hypothetical protein ACLQDQ_14375 [Myxococcaceae bacterium]
MFKFDDKWRRRLLEDALVADLLDFPRDGRPSSGDRRGPLGGATALSPTSMATGDVRVDARAA